MGDLLKLEDGLQRRREEEKQEKFLNFVLDQLTSVLSEICEKTQDPDIDIVGAFLQAPAVLLASNIEFVADGDRQMKEEITSSIVGQMLDLLDIDFCDEDEEQ